MLCGVSSHIESTDLSTSNNKETGTPIVTKIQFSTNFYSDPSTCSTQDILCATNIAYTP